MKKLHNYLLLAAIILTTLFGKTYAQKPDFDVLDVRLVTDIWDTVHQNILYPKINRIHLFMKVRNNGPALTTGDTISFFIAEPQGPTHSVNFLLLNEFPTDSTTNFVTPNQYNVISVLIDYSYCAAVSFASNGYQLQGAEWFQKMKCAKSVTWDVTGIGSFQSRGGKLHLKNDQLLIQGGNSELRQLEVKIYSIGGNLIHKEYINQLAAGETRTLQKQFSLSGLYIATVMDAEGNISSYKLTK